jgi:hypothetical protein
MEATMFQRTGLAAAAVQAHEAVLAEFDVDGSAQLLREGTWFYFDEAAVARSVETVTIVAILIATMGFTGFLSPPGGWGTEGDGLVALALRNDSTATAPFTVFAVSNALALAVSMWLVLMLAVVNSFGLKAQGMRLVLLTGFGFLALAVGSSFVAFGAAAFLMSPSNKEIPYAVIWILCCFTLAAAAWLIWLVRVVQRRARRDAYRERLCRLCQMLTRSMHALRSLNNSYFLSTDEVVGDVFLLQYFHFYAAVMLATVIPLFHHFLEEAPAHVASKHVAELLQLLRGVKPAGYTAAQHQQRPQAHGLLRYWSGWLADCQHFDRCHAAGIDIDDTCRACQWDVGVIGLQCERYSGGRQHLLITGGSLPCTGRSVLPQVLKIDQCARDLVCELLTAGSRPASLGLYRGQVKLLFMHANLSHMMPPSIRLACI